VYVATPAPPHKGSHEGQVGPLGQSVAQFQQLAGFSQPQVAAFTRPITSTRLSSLLLNPVLPNRCLLSEAL